MSKQTLDVQTNPDAAKVLEFWFDEAHKPFWFEKSEQFDSEIEKQFANIWKAAKAGECAHWRETIEGALAEIIVLDQFSRNLCRQSANAFAQDGMAIVLAQEAIKRPAFSKLPKEQQKFILMPFMHSESAVIHQQALPLFEALEDDYTLRYEIMHKDIITRFGRYPHRNAVLGRESTPEEVAFLDQPNSSF